MFVFLTLGKEDKTANLKQIGVVINNGTAPSTIRGLSRWTDTVLTVTAVMTFARSLIDC